jgi:hypothetical protein
LVLTACCEIYGGQSKKEKENDVEQSENILMPSVAFILMQIL